MKKGIGLPVFSGVAIGPAVVYRKAQRTLPASSGDPAVEKAKFEAALEMARQALLSMKTPVTSVQNSLDEIRFAHYRQSGGEITPGQLADSLRAYIGLVELYWAVIPDYCPVAGKTLAESHLRRETGMSVVGVLREGRFISNLQADFRLEAGDTVAAIGDSAAREKWETLLGTSAAETAAAAAQQAQQG